MTLLNYVTQNIRYKKYDVKQRCVKNIDVNAHFWLDSMSDAKKDIFNKGILRFTT